MSIVSTAQRPRARPGALSEEQLLTRAACGDAEAFAALYDRVAPQAYGLARHVARDDALAQEITHDALLAVWSGCRRFDASKGSARAWIMTIVHRRAVDVVRMEQSSRNRLEGVAARSWEVEYDVVSEAAMRTLAAAGVRQALELLTALERQAVQLAYFGGFTHREVAEIVDVPLGTAKSRISSGLRRLRAAFAEDDRVAAVGQ